MSADQISHVRIITPDPVPVLTARWGETVATARQRVSQLEDSLRDLDKIRGQLAAHQITVGEDLGATGNAAMAAWKTCETHKVDHDEPTFTLPRDAA